MAQGTLRRDYQRMWASNIVTYYILPQICRYVSVYDFHMTQRRVAELEPTLEFRAIMYTDLYSTDIYTDV